MLLAQGRHTGSASDREKGRMGTMAQHERGAHLGTANFAQVLADRIIAAYHERSIGIGTYRVKMLRELRQATGGKSEKIATAKLEGMVERLVEISTPKYSRPIPEEAIHIEVNGTMEICMCVLRSSKPEAYLEFMEKWLQNGPLLEWLSVISKRDNARVRPWKGDNIRRLEARPACIKFFRNPTRSEMKKLETIFDSLEEWKEKEKKGLLAYLKNHSRENKKYYLKFCEELAEAGIAIARYGTARVIANIRSEVRLPIKFNRVFFPPNGFVISHVEILDFDKRRAACHDLRIPRGWCDPYGLYIVDYRAEDYIAGLMDAIFSSREGQSEDKKKTMEVIQHELEHLFHIEVGFIDLFENREYPADLAQMAFGGNPKHMLRNAINAEQQGERHRSALLKIRIGLKARLGVRKDKDLKGLEDEKLIIAARKLLNDEYRKTLGLTYDELIEPFVAAGAKS